MALKEWIFGKPKISKHPKYNYQQTFGGDYSDEKCENCNHRYNIYRTKSMKVYCADCLYDFEQTDPDYAVGLEQVDKIITYCST